MAIKCAFMLRCLKKPGQCKHARKHLDDWLAFGNYAGTGIHYLKLPHACLIPFRRRMLSHMLSLQSDIHVLEKKWIASRIRFCVGKMPTFKDDWNHAKLCRASGPWPQSSATPFLNAYLAQLSEWTETGKSPREWQKQKSLNSAMGSCLKSRITWNVPKKNRFRPRPFCRFPCRKRFGVTGKHRTRHNYIFFSTRMTWMCLQALLQYQTTKPKKVGWKMPIASYLLLCMSFASASASWERCQASPMEANQWLCMFVMSVLGTKLARRLKISRSSFLLPYVYITMKAKCWCQALRVCRKPFHSCVRKVVSYATGKANVYGDPSTTGGKQSWNIVARPMTFGASLMQTIVLSKTWKAWPPTPLVFVCVARAACQVVQALLPMLVNSLRQWHLRELSQRLVCWWMCSHVHMVKHLFLSFPAENSWAGLEVKGCSTPTKVSLGMFLTWCVRSLLPCQ